MKKIQVEITGETPLLMNSPKAMLLEASGEVQGKLKKRDPKIEAEKVAYRMEKSSKFKKGELYVPAEAIKGTLINAASYKKVGKYALRPIIAGGTRIQPRQIGLGTENYEIDARTVVIQRARVVKQRPILNKWKINFEIIYNEKMIGDDKIIKQCLEEAGERVGILDFRPEHTGEFGCFKVTKWKATN